MTAINENNTARDVGEDPVEAEKSQYDSAWKSIIRKLFKDFLLFFFPDLHDAIDFDREIVFLDKELKEIQPDSNQGDREADLLVKVHLKDGGLRYICIVVHIEVQGDTKRDFMERMFIYYYRIFDKEKNEQIPVISMAILTDNNPNLRPGPFLIDLFGFELRMKIPIIKITDYKTRPDLVEKLETSSNPMKMIVLAQLKSHEVKHADGQRKFEVTKELIRQCYSYGYSREETRIILNFFDWAIRLPEVYKQQIASVIKEVEEEQNMEYIPLWERDSWEKGLKQGADNEKMRAARRMFKDGLSIETIRKYTGLPLGKIKKLIPPTTH